MNIFKTRRKYCLIYFLLLVIPGLFLMQTPAHAKTILIDSFEGSLGWKSNPSGDLATLSIAPQNATEGKNSLHVSFQSTGKGKAVISHPESRDLSSINALVLDVTNPQATPVDIALALQTGASWTWFESKPFTLIPGLNKNVRFDLTKKDFKSTATQWQFTTVLGDIAQLQQIVLLIFPGQLKKVDVFIDNICWEQAGSNQKKTESPVISSKQTVEQIPPSEYVAPKLVSVTAEDSAVEKFAKFESSVKFTGTYQNPFDPDDIRLDAIVTSPTGKQFTVPGYLHSQPDHWKIRFAPNETGTWTYVIKVTNPKGSDESREYKFECIASHLKGPIHVDKSDEHYFRYDNGDFCYPIGENIGWLADPEINYPIFFSKMDDAKANWARVWMSRWGWLSIEEKEDEYGGHGLGWYSLENAKRLDRVLDSAEQNGVYVQLVLNYHGQFSSTVNPNWDDNPFNVKQGGFLKSGGEVFTNESAKRLFRNRYRYIVARWGYHSAIMGWELFNEVSQTDDFDKQKKIVGDWHEEMAAFIHSLDFSKHLVTTSFSDEARDKKDIDYTQIHCYNKDYIGSVQLLADSYYPFKKPVFFGEIGDPDGYADDTEGVAMHQWMWTSVAQPQGACAMGWTWDSYVDPDDLYRVFTPVVNFAKNLDRAEYKLDQNAKVVINSSSKNYSDLSFGPVLGWEPSTESTFDVGNDGVVTHLKGLSSFFQGPNHPEMRVEPIFNLHCLSTCQFIIDIGQVSSYGASFAMYLDGNLSIQKDFPTRPNRREIKINSTFSIPLTPGQHQVRISGTKGDWFLVNKITIKNYGLPAKVIGVAGQQGAVLWVTNPQYSSEQYYKGIHPQSVGGISLNVQGLQDGQYQIEFWDTYKGIIISKFNAFTENGKIDFSIPSFDKDMAVKIYQGS